MEVKNWIYLVSHTHSYSAWRRDIWLERHLVAEWCSLNWQFFSLNNEVLIKYPILAKYVHKWGSLIWAMFSGRIMQFQMTNPFIYWSTHTALKCVNFWTWMVVKHWIYLVFNINSSFAWRRDIICISCWESFENI